MPNSQSRGLLFAFAVLILLLGVGNVRASDEDMVASAETAWKQFLTKSFAEGQTEKQVRQAMDGKFRDVGITHLGGTGRYEVTFLIDDFHEVVFSFERESKLSATPFLLPKSQWLRYPSGELVRLREQAERTSTAKSEKKAQEKISLETAIRLAASEATGGEDLSSSISTLFAKRSDDKKGWSIILQLNETPKNKWYMHYHFVVSDEGHVQAEPTE